MDGTHLDGSLHQNYLKFSADTATIQIWYPYLASNENYTQLTLVCTHHRGRGKLVANGAQVQTSSCLVLTSTLTHQNIISV